MIKIKNLHIFLIPLIVCLFLTIVIIVSIKNSKSYNNKFDSIVERKVEGKITNIKIGSRGTSWLEVDSCNKIDIYLTISFEIEKHNIKVGDSVSKKSNSKVISFYSKYNNSYIKYLDFEMF